MGVVEVGGSKKITICLRNLRRSLSCAKEFSAEACMRIKLTKDDEIESSKLFAYSLLICLPCRCRPATQLATFAIQNMTTTQ